jgi:broad specificity phosphatase PhoE
MVAQRWPETLWLVRHGESAGNVARDAADAAGLHRIALDGRDVDVPLSPLGERQADALGRWFAAGHEDGRPEVILASPYVRAMETACRFRTAGGAPADRPVCPDERLREKEFGILDGLTVSGIHAHQPEQYALRQRLGKFYHRPPGGESWADVIFRLRSMMDTVSLHHGGQRVMIVAHQVVVLCLRYILETMTEAEILAVDKAADVANCSITEYRFDRSKGQHGGLRLVRYNETAPMERSGAPVTDEPDRKANAA